MPDANGRRIAPFSPREAVRRNQTASRTEGVVMTLLDAFSASLQIISSWVMAVLALLAILVSVVVCLALAEFVFEYAAVAQAYTVKANSTDNDVSSDIHRSAM
jgi:hypothetical protein